MNNYLFQNYNASEIKWDGENIPCIGLCRGDMISDTVYKIATRICGIVSDLNDLKKLKLTCLIGYCEKCEKDKSLKAILQLLLDNDCKLNDLLTEITNLINEKSELKLTLDFSKLGKCSSYSEILPKYPSCNISLDEDCVITPFEDCDCTDVDFINDCGEAVDYTINELLQYMIDRLCCQKNLLAQIESKLDQVEEDYETLASTVSVYQEPKITTCLSTTPRLHSLTTTSLITEVCSLRSDLGSSTDITNAIAAQCIYTDHALNFNLLTDLDLVNNEITVGPHRFVDGQAVTYQVAGSAAVIDQLVDGATYYVIVVDDTTIQLSAAQSPLVAIDLISTTGPFVPPPVSYITAEGIILSPQNLANSSQNQWAVLCNINERLKTIKNGDCCQPDCKDVRIGFQSTYIEDQDVYQLTFKSDYGNQVPSGWVDCGSKLTIEDYKGIFYIYDIEILPEFTYDIELTGLDTSKPLTLTIKTCLTHEETNLQCKECYAYTLSAIASESCDFCRICAGGSNQEDQVKIYYYTQDNTNVRSSILNPGTCLTFKLPDEAPTITNVIVMTKGSDIEVSTDPSTQCSEDLIIPTPLLSTCWVFNIPMSYGFQEAINKIMVSGVVIPAVPQVGIGNVDMNLVSDSANVLEFVKLKTSTSPNYLSISGKTLSLLEVSNNYILASANVPIVASGTEVIAKTACGAGYDITWDASSPFTDSNGESVGIGGANFPTLGAAPQFGSGGFSPLTIPVKIQENAAGSGMYIVLKLQGQDINTPPVLVLKDPITSAEMSITGLYTEDVCSCEA